MQNNDDLWYRIGFALESARRKGLPGTRSGSEDGGTPLPGRTRKMVSAGKKGNVPGDRGSGPLDDASKKLLEAVLTVGAGGVLSRLLAFWPGRRKPGLFRLGKAGAAGAAAAFMAGLIRPLLSTSEEEPLDDEIVEVLLSGAGRGLLYAAIVEPRIPGPGLLQGAVYGALEWALVPWGGLEDLAGPVAPQGKIPVLAALLRSRGEEDQLLEHLVFGMALALLYQD